MALTEGNEDSSSFDVYVPRGPLTKSTFLPKIKFMDYFVYVTSSIGLWFGFAVIGLWQAFSIHDESDGSTEETERSNNIKNKKILRIIQKQN